MQKPLTFLFLSCFAALQTCSLLNLTALEQPSTKSEVVETFHPFAGKVSKNKVRMRLQPSLDSAVLRELNKDDLLIILSETEDFYGIQAPADIRAYVYRTFVLDNVVEGNHVNVRLEPNLEAPVIVQLNSGDHVDGVISPINGKWLEITTPKSVQFYVAKDFVEKIGEPSLVETITRKRESINRLLESTYQISELELEKPFQQIQMDGIFQNLNKVISDKNNLSEQIEKARSMLTTIQDKYLQKKIAFLEEKPQNVIVTTFPSSHDKQPELANSFQEEPKKNPVTAKMLSWIPQEQSIYKKWLETHPGKTENEFYESEKHAAITLKGLVESYDRTIKNKPGDYILVTGSNRQPVAYLYSTLINLQDLLGEDVILEVVSRPNNNFAFPAYFVIGVE